VLQWGLAGTYLVCAVLGLGGVLLTGASVEPYWRGNWLPSSATQGGGGDRDEKGGGYTHGSHAEQAPYDLDDDGRPMGDAADDLLGNAHYPK
jgi:hypothetical protein